MKAIPNIERTKESAREYMYKLIKQQIMNWELVPGTKISEKKVAEKYQVSRTPIREAFMKLAQDELLGIYPQSGTIISQVDLQLVEEGRFVREQLERAIVKEACTSFNEEDLFKLETNMTMQDFCIKKGSYHRLFELDEEFHRLLFEGCNKIRTWRMIRQLNIHFDRLRMLRLSSNLDWEVVVSQHKAIFEAITNRNAEEAEKAMTSHLHLVNVEREELEERYPDYFK